MYLIISFKKEDHVAKIHQNNSIVPLNNYLQDIFTLISFT